MIGESSTRIDASFEVIGEITDTIGATEQVLQKSRGTGRRSMKNAGRFRETEETYTKTTGAGGIVGVAGGSLNK
jgi:hypothetical protein